MRLPAVAVAATSVEIEPVAVRIEKRTTSVPFKFWPARVSVLPSSASVTPLASIIGGNSFTSGGCGGSSVDTSTGIGSSVPVGVRVKSLR